MTSVPKIVFGLLRLSRLYSGCFCGNFNITMTLVIFNVTFVIVRDFGGREVPGCGGLDRIAFALTTCVNLFRVLTTTFPKADHSNTAVVNTLVLNMSHITTSRFAFILTVPTVLNTDLFRFGSFLRTSVGVRGGRVTMLIVNILITFTISILTVGFLLDFVEGRSFGTFNCCHVTLNTVIVLCFTLH